MDRDATLSKAQSIVADALESGMPRPVIRSFLDAATSSITHVLYCPATKMAAIIDPVMGYEPVGGRLSTEPADRILDYVVAEGLSVAWLLETHIHADHLSAANYLQAILGGRTAIGARVVEVRAHFAPLYPAAALPGPGETAFDRLLVDGDEIVLGELVGLVLAVPGHTPANMAFLFGDALFVGDTLMMPDFGTARADFPGGDAAALYRSIGRLLTLPAETQIFLCHDYVTSIRKDLCWRTSVGAQREHNLHVGGGVPQAVFVERRMTRDRQLSLPRLIVEAIQVNLRAGALPPPDDRGVRSLSIPLDSF